MDFAHKLWRVSGLLYFCKILEFSLNDFPWIQRIQWIMTKSKSSMVTRGITQLATDTLPIQSVFSLLPLGRYQLPITTPSRYQPTDSSGKLLYTTISRNVTFVRCRISLVTILLLDLVMIHWIRWIQGKSFRENSTGYFHSFKLRWKIPNKSSWNSYQWNSYKVCQIEVSKFGVISFNIYVPVIFVELFRQKLWILVSFLVTHLLKQSVTYLVCLACVCVCVDQNKATPPAKGNFYVYRFDLTKLTPPPSQNFTDAFHHITPSLPKEILMSTDLTWLSWPPPSQNFTDAFHHIIPSLLKEILMSIDLTWPSWHPLAKISQMHSIMLHFPPGQNFKDAFHHVTPTPHPQPNFHRCIPSCYTYPPPKIHRCIPSIMLYLPPTKILQMHSITLHLPPTPLAKISQMHSITLHQYTNIKCHVTQCW